MFPVGRATDNISLKSVGLAAYEVALVQQRAFEETLRELAARKEQENAEAERKAALERAQQQHPAADEKKASGFVVDVVVNGGKPDDSGTSAETNGQSRGTSVDVAV